MDAGTQNHQSVTTESDFELLPFLRSPGCVLVFAFCSLVGGCFYSLANSDAIRVNCCSTFGKRPTETLSGLFNSPVQVLIFGLFTTFENVPHGQQATCDQSSADRASSRERTLRISLDKPRSESPEHRPHNVWSSFGRRAVLTIDLFHFLQNLPDV